MSNFSKKFKTLEKNLLVLVDSKKRAEEELNKCRKEMEDLTHKLNHLETEIEDLREKNKILRIAGGAKNGNSREIKLKINEIVREVDKCIAQLNQ